MSMSARELKIKQGFMRQSAIISVLVFFAAPVLAQEAAEPVNTSTSPVTASVPQEPPPPKKWKETAELSYVQTSGNSRTSSISGKNLFNYDWDKAALEAAFGGLGTRDGHTSTAEQFNASEKVSLKLAGRNYAFQKTAWDRNRFAGIRSRFDYSLGLGRELMDRPNDKFSMEAGGGYIFEDRLNSDNQTFGTYRGYMKYIRSLSPTANASQDFEYLGNLRHPGGYRTNSETAIVTSISTHFSLKASYVWHYSNSPAEGFKKADTITSMAFIINY
jgi:putative salt-induced outer membrane protein